MVTWQKKHFQWRAHAPHRRISLRLLPTQMMKLLLPIALAVLSTSVG